MRVAGVSAGRAEPISEGVEEEHRGGHEGHTGGNLYAEVNAILLHIS